MYMFSTFEEVNNCFLQIFFYMYMVIFFTKQGNKSIINQQKIICTNFLASLVTNILVPNLCEIFAVSASAMPYSKGIF